MNRKFFLRACSFCLRLYPPAFREAYGEPMLQALRDASEDGALGSPLVRFRIVADLLISVCRENLSMFHRDYIRRAIIFQAMLLVVLCSMFALAIFGAVQHTLRSGANDPQLQMAGEAADQLASGADAASVVGSSRIDMARSLAPFLIVYDGNANPLASAALLHGSAPRPPIGVFQYAAEHHHNVLTWQPERGVRIAAVIEPFAGPHPGYVLAGRSLRIVEDRTNGTLQMVALAWISMMGVVVVATGGFLWAMRAFPVSA